MNWWYYFNRIDPTNGNILLFLLVLTFCMCIGAMWYGYSELLFNKDTETSSFYWNMWLGAFLGGGWFLFLMWLFMGKSTWWSLIIRNWFNR